MLSADETMWTSRCDGRDGTEDAESWTRRVTRYDAIDKRVLISNHTRSRHERERRCQPGTSVHTVHCELYLT
jgi:hypothetical protein